jgi:hypothetical protein
MGVIRSIDRKDGPQRQFYRIRSFKTSCFRPRRIRMPDVQAPRNPEDLRILRWLAGLALGGLAGPLVLYAVLRGLQPASILEVTIVTDANEPVRVAEASFAGWPLTVEYAADGAVRFHHEHTQRRAGELRLAVDVDGARHSFIRRIDLRRESEWEDPVLTQVGELFRFPRAVPTCRIVALAGPSQSSVTGCLRPFAY